MIRNSITILIGSLVVLALVLTGCSSPATSPTSVPPTSTTSSAITTPSPAATSLPTTSVTPTNTATSVTEVKPIVLKFSHQDPPAAWTTKTVINPWANKVEEVTQGRVKIDMYPAQTLAKENQNLEAVESDVADMGWITVGLYANVFPLTEVLTLPFIAPTSGKINGELVNSSIVDSHIQEQLYQEFPAIQAEWKDVHLLFLFTPGTYFIATKNKPIHNQADLQGLKMRAEAGGQLDALKALGATPLTVPIPDIYEDAQKGVIDGMTAAWAQIATFRLYEVLHQYTSVGISTDTLAFVMNKDKWNSLPKNIQDEITSVSGMQGAEFPGRNGWGTALTNQVQAAMQKEGDVMHKNELDAGQLEKWKAIAGTPIWNKWVADMQAKGLPGQKVLDEAVRLAKLYGS